MAADSSEKFRENVRGSLSKTLVIRQDLNEEQIDRIVELQISKHYLFQQMQEASAAFENSKLVTLAEQVTDMEFLLQVAWNLKPDETHHRFWAMPGCICPVISNIERYPSDSYEYTKACPIHGSKHK